MTDTPVGYIYVTEVYTPDNPSRVYVGKCHSAVFNDKYYGSGDYIKYAKSKYGVSVMKVTLIGFFKTLTDLNAAEISTIADYRFRFGNRCRNKAGGGDGVGSGELSPWFGKKHSEETKRRMSVNNAKRRPEIAAMMSGSNHPMFGRRGSDSPIFGRKHSEETLAKMKLARKLYWEKRKANAQI
jgi:hypothetical protein